MKKVLEDKLWQTKKDYIEFLNELVVPDKDDERWIIGGKNRCTGRSNYGVMLKRYDPIGFQVGYKEWVENERV